ncbi:MAG: sensor histidine kinase [Acidimicrobiales bacterium]
MAGSLMFATATRGTGGVPHSGSGSLDALGAALVVASAAPVLAWRRAPMGAFASAACASILLAALGYTVVLPLGATAALHLAAASRDEARPWAPGATAVAVGLFLAYVGAITAAEGRFPALDASHVGLAWVAAWFAGERARLRRQQVADLQERSGRAQRDAERERLLAVAEERARIARDLHDSAGHAINVIAVRAGAARLRHGRDPERSLAALAAIEELARQTAAEIDLFVGALRDDSSGDDPVEAPAGLASLDALVAQHAASGLEVTLGLAGEPRPLGPGADQAAFRILQEALTNAARHGSGAARVELGFGERALEVTVTNPLAAGTTMRANGGHGLVGMYERAALLGGDLEAERSEGIFRVRAVLPYGGHGP